MQATFVRPLLTLVCRTVHPTRSITTGRPGPRLSTPFSAVPPARPHIQHRRPLQPTPADPSRRPTNHHIPFEHVYVLDPSTHTRSSAPQRLATLLKTRGRLVVELLASSPDPIVRVATRDEVEGRYREMRRAAKKGARAGGEVKEVQLTWGVARADLEHKLRKAGRDLDKGYGVVVAVSIKRGHRPSSQQELVAFGDEIAAVLGEVGRECKEREITQRSMVLSFRKNKGDDKAS